MEISIVMDVQRVIIAIRKAAWLVCLHISIVGSFLVFTEAILITVPMAIVAVIRLFILWLEGNDLEEEES